MPPKKKPAAAKASPTSLKDCYVAFATSRLAAGSLLGMNLTQAKAEIAAREGNYVGEVDAASGCTHLVVTSDQFQKQSGKVSDAINNTNVKIVSFDWLKESFNSNDPVNEDKFTLLDRKQTKSAGKTTNVVANQTKPAAGKKRGRKADSDDHDEDGKDSATSKKVKSDPGEEAEAPKDAQKAKSKALTIPLDDGLSAIYKVFVGEDGMIYDAALNQTNSGKNNNKFYRLQILTDPKGKFSCWTRWGRVGERGQSKMIEGPTFDNALKEFEKKFKDKSGHTWDDRHGEFKSGKYAFIEKNYEDSDDEEEETDVKKEKIKEETEEPIESKLAKPIQRLMELIFNLEYFNKTFEQLNYDANKMPLGKLSKRTLLRGYDVLKELAALVPTVPMNDPRLAEKSDQYFSLIPHAFGRRKPPILQSQDLIKQEIELLETLTDMALANDIMKEAKSQKQERLNLYDRQYQGLGMREMTPVDPASSEFDHLQSYLVKSAGQTHNVNYTVQDIFRIERDGEFDRFDKSRFGKYANTDRRLLWHGSRCTNFGGILSQGLRIAPPEAPVSGYMFGKGIYLADMSSKSAGYTWAGSSGGVGLLLLCEAELGKPPLKLTNADYNAGERAVNQGSISTWGVGRTAPMGWKDASCIHDNLKGILMPDVAGVGTGATNENGAGLYYNEYIVYDVAQIKLRYLLRVKMY